jgi:hypothetical protein
MVSWSEWTVKPWRHEQVDAIQKRVVVPGYTVTLGFWVIPTLIIGIFLWKKKLLHPVQKKALAINISVVTMLGLVMELLWAQYFFLFPNPDMVLGLYINNIPIEELLFYPTGFWFVCFMYVFCDEYWLHRYNNDDSQHMKVAADNGLPIYPKPTVLQLAIVLAIVGFEIWFKHTYNPIGGSVPGFMVFLTMFSMLPLVIFWKVTSPYVNTRAFVVTVLVTVLISIIWEVTLALPGGYWRYNDHFMMGIFIEPWNHLPIEASMVWLSASAIILTYEFTLVVVFNHQVTRGGKSIEQAHGPLVGPS